MPGAHAEERGDNPRADHAAVPLQVDANPFVANAAVPGDRFQWHVDADPSEFVDSEWTREHGRYFNRVGQTILSFHRATAGDVHQFMALWL